MFEVVENHPIS